MDMGELELQNCINYLLTTAQHGVFQMFSGRLAQFNITPGQYGVLSCLWQKGACTPKELAQILAERTRSQVVQVIGKKIVLYKEGKDKNKKIQLP